mmetsp:Transcript_68715/g.212448  ORF Transcript_68715/g.212448 Transcript_68715/m.212448 type:complete len:344 (+) Transcript_68715:1008-2039(+)
MPQALLRCRAHPLVGAEHPLADRAGLRRGMGHEGPVRPLAVEADPLRAAVQAGAEERDLPREELEHHHAEAPDVRDGAEVPPPHLRRHVRGRASDHRAAGTAPEPGGEELRDAEVDDDGVRLRRWIIHVCRVKQQDVLGLEVLMHDALGVHVGDRLQALPDHHDDPALRQVHGLGALLLEDLVELAPCRTLHDEVYVLVVLVVLEQPDDMRVVARLHVLDLPLHLRRWDLRLALVDGLEHAVQAGPPVPDQVRHAEGAFSELLDGLVRESRPAVALLHEEGPDIAHRRLIAKRLPSVDLRSARGRAVHGRALRAVGVAGHEAGRHNFSGRQVPRPPRRVAHRP